MTDLSTLIDRVRKATGPDRELDYGIHNATNPPLPSGYVHGMVPRYTGTVDAALALAERVLPGCSWGVRTTMEGGFLADIPFVQLKDMSPEHVNHITAPLAIVLATLLAIQSKGAS